MLYACSIGTDVWFVHAINDDELCYVLMKKWGHQSSKLRNDVITFQGSHIVVRFRGVPGVSEALDALRQIAAPSSSAITNHTAEILIYEAICKLEGREQDDGIDMDNPDSSRQAPIPTGDTDERH